MFKVSGLPCVTKPGRYSVRRQILRNFSLLYKDQKSGLDAQLSLAYTGERIAAVSQYYGLDTWEKASTYLDFSAQKELGKHFIVFVKANNLLNTPYELFIKQNNTSNYTSAEIPAPGKSLLRRHNPVHYNQHIMPATT